MAEAFRHEGKPYLWDRNGPNAFDCSGFVHYVMRTVLGPAKFSLPYALSQIKGYRNQSVYYRDQLRAQRAGIACADAKAADIVFFNPKHRGENFHIGIISDPKREWFITAQGKGLGVDEHPYGAGTYWGERAPECYRNVWLTR